MGTVELNRLCLREINASVKVNVPPYFVINECDRPRGTGVNLINALHRWAPSMFTVIVSDTGVCSQGINFTQARWESNCS